MAPLVDEITELLIAELNLRRSPQELDPQAPLFGPDGLGLDSLDALQIATAIEEKYGVRIPEGKEAHPIFQSIASLAAYVASAR
ncbi:MAG: phosphopantetheine-binding protein [Myxococcales bacterium]|nr:phosphopantetheine-binding protein [Polyangiaceae bacterium]MDW8249338.1 phosphopantetheine-binding protein [Myxococcales bacterium]